MFISYCAFPSCPVLSFPLSSPIYSCSGQMLMTSGEMGYLIVDVDSEVSTEVRQQMAQLDASIKTRLLY